MQGWILKFRYLRQTLRSLDFTHAI